MSFSHPLKRGIVAVSAAGSLLAAATPAQAVTTNPGAVVGSFDPAFGIDIPNLGFKGTFQLRVLGCNPGAGGGYVFVGGNCTMTMESLTLDFYNSTTNPTGDPNIADGYFQSYTLGYTNSSFPNAFPTNYIEGGYYNAADQFVGFDTTDSNQFLVNAFDTGNGGFSVAYSGDMLLFFKSGFQPGSVPGDPAFLVDCTSSIPGTAEQACNRTTYVRSNGARVTINGVPEPEPGTVPEPETVALTLIGLAALTANRWGRRRRLN